MGRKIVHDPIHGSIVLEDVFLDVADRHEVQRLRQLKHLGLGYMVFPGANHSRFEHSIGVHHLVGRMCQTMKVSREVSDTIRMAALLHDVCHGPFSHATEPLLKRYCNMDHMDLSRSLINGSIPSFMERDRDFLDGVEPLSVLMEDAGIPADTVCDLIIKPTSDVRGLEVFDSGCGVQSYFASNDYANQMIHGPVDADQMDYLLRDAHYTGVVHGTIDKDRLMNQMAIHNGQMVLMKGGISSAEALIVSRTLMYSTIYFHKTKKILESMLVRAMEMSSLDLSELYLMTDADLVSSLLGNGGVSADLMRRILNRRIYKKAMIVYSNDASDDFRSSLVKYTSYDKCRELEHEIAKVARVDPSEVIVNIPSESTLLSKLQVGKTDVSILDGDKVRSLSRFSSLAKSIQSRDPIDWCVMVAVPPHATEAVGRAAARVLSFDDTDRS